MYTYLPILCSLDLYFLHFRLTLGEIAIDDSAGVCTFSGPFIRALLSDTYSSSRLVSLGALALLKCPAMYQLSDIL